MPTTYNCVHYDRDLMRSCIYGLAVGDALGVPYEFRERGTFECTGMVGDGTHRQYAGTWSDDTSMALCICASIKRLGIINTADIAYRFRQWLGHGDYACDGRVFDIGITCKRAISTSVPGKSYDDCGNGSLMRTAPLAMLDPSNPAIYARSRQSPMRTRGRVVMCHTVRHIADYPQCRHAGEGRPLA